MMSMTHIAIGISTALVMTKPQTLEDLIAPIIGGTIGGIISDVDVHSNSYCRDALYGRLFAILIVISVLAIDWYGNYGIMQDLLMPEKRFKVYTGLISLAILVLIGLFQSHRGLTHSILYGLLTTIAVYLISPSISICFYFGFISHLLLDILNKKPVRIFFPIKAGICLKLFYANKFANKVFLLIGVIYLVLYVARLYITI